MVSPLIYLGFHLQTLSCLARVPEVPALLLVSPMPTRTQNSFSIAHLTQTAGLTVMVKASAWPSSQQTLSWKGGSTISSFYGQKPHSVGVEPVPQNKPCGRRWKEGFIKENRVISPKMNIQQAPGVPISNQDHHSKHTTMISPVLRISLPILNIF